MSWTCVPPKCHQRNPGLVPPKMSYTGGATGTRVRDSESQLNELIKTDECRANLEKMSRTPKNRRIDKPIKMKIQEVGHKFTNHREG